MTAAFHLCGCLVFVFGRRVSKEVAGFVLKITPKEQVGAIDWLAAGGSVAKGQFVHVSVLALPPRTRLVCSFGVVFGTLPQRAAAL